MDNVGVAISNPPNLTPVGSTDSRFAPVPAKRFVRGVLPPGAGHGACRAVLVGVGQLPCRSGMAPLGTNKTGD